MPRKPFCRLDAALTQQKARPSSHLEPVQVSPALCQLERRPEAWPRTLSPQPLLLLAGLALVLAMGGCPPSADDDDDVGTTETPTPSPAGDDDVGETPTPSQTGDDDVGETPTPAQTGDDDVGETPTPAQTGDDDEVGDTEFPTPCPEGDFGVYVYTWVDANCDGVVDLEEPPLPGVEIVVAVVGSYADPSSGQTDANGYWHTLIGLETCDSSSIDVGVAAATPDGYQPTARHEEQLYQFEFGFALEGSCP